MSDAARLARQAYLGKPGGLSYVNFSVPLQSLQAINGQLSVAAIDNAYAALVSYTEAMTGIKKGSSAWSMVRLYYSAFYSIKSIMIAKGVVPFNGGAEMVLDANLNKFLKGGKSSHHWNWVSLKSTSIKNEWFCSQDSIDAYNKLREFRERASYTHVFPDPDLYDFLVIDKFDIEQRFRVYRDDAAFLYTYLPEHLAIAYPTKLVFEVEASLGNAGCRLDAKRIQHIKSIWKFRDRCPFADL